MCTFNSVVIEWVGMRIFVIHFYHNECLYLVAEVLTRDSIIVGLRGFAIATWVGEHTTV